jgi:predicted NodU family carbamoyl transferase
MLKEIHFPHSLGLLYSAFTYYTGFKVNSGRVQGDGAGALRRAEVQGHDPEQHRRPQGRRHLPLDQSYFDYCTGLRMTNDKFAELFGGPARKPDKELLKPEAHGPRRLGSRPVDRGDRAAAGAFGEEGDRCEELSAWPAAWR